MNPIRNLVFTNEFLKRGQKTMNNLPKISNGARKILFFLIVASFLITGGLARAGTGDNVSGYAWSENIGWISFNILDKIKIHSMVNN